MATARSEPSRTAQATAPTVRAALPAWAPGLRIGLFGGSFDPPHEGHLMASRVARRRLKLDQVWWLVSPHNPLKPDQPSQDLARRMAAARAAADDPAFRVTAIEAALGTRYTVDLIAWLKKHLTGVELVWIMGADNLAQFHRWRGWRQIAAMVPMAVIDRPGASLTSLASPAARALAGARLPERAAAGLAGHRPPAWVYLHGPLVAASSTEIRARKTAGRGRMS